MRTRRPRVVYWNNQPTPYVVERFNAVAEAGAIDFQAWFDNYRESDRSWDVTPSNWRFPAVTLGTTDADSPLCRIPIELLDHQRPDLLISGYDRIHMVLGLLAAKPLVARTAVRCLPTWPAWETPSWTRSTAKHLLFRSVDGAKVPGPDGAAYARKFGLPTERTWTVTQSIDLQLYSSARSVEPSRREALRGAWGIKGCAFLYVGRLWRGKGVDNLIAAFRELASEQPDVSLIIAGDGPDESELRRAAAGVANIYWTGFIQPSDLPAVYAASDVLVFPTLGDPNGLVVEEAMAAALPVISTSAAGDIRARLPHGVAGFVVEPGRADVLLPPMRLLAADPDRRHEMGSAAARLAARADVGNYARDFGVFVEGVLTRPRRCSLASRLARLTAGPLAASIRVRRTPDMRDRIVRYGASA